MSRGRLAGVGAILASSLLWGTTGTAATFAPGVGPLAIGAAALGIGGLLQAVVASRGLWREASALRRYVRLVMLGAMAVAVYPLAFYSSMSAAGVAIGSVVSLAFAPLASGLLEWAAEGTPLTRWWMLATALGVLGSTFLCLSRVEASSSSAAGTLVGVLLGLAAAASYATYSWVARRLMDTGVSRAASMGAVFGGGGVLLMPVLIVTGAPLVATTNGVAVAAYMALVPMFLGYLLFGFGLTKVPANTATTITLAEPAVAAVLAVVVVGERLNTLGWTGLGLIGLALVVLAAAPAGESTRGQRKRTVERPSRPTELADHRPPGPALPVGPEK